MRLLTLAASAALLAALIPGAAIADTTPSTPTPPTTATPDPTTSEPTPEPAVTTLTLNTPTTVKDETDLTFTTTATTDGTPIPNATITATITEPSRGYTKTLTATTNTDGQATFTTRIYNDATITTTLVHNDATHTSTTNPIDFKRAAPTVSLPGPKPSGVKTQPRATSSGPNVRVTSIPDSVWKSMQGRSWRKGCMSRSKLAYVRVNYWGFDGYRHQGELIIAKSATSTYTKGLTNLYKKQVPIRSMFLVDKYGYSKKLKGADDYKSMRADNTSAFNCRQVVGRPGVKSPHATGKAFDINPWENPYGKYPNTYWRKKDHKSKAAWNSKGDTAVKALTSAGFRWTYGNADGHHFDAR